MCETQSVTYLMRLLVQTMYSTSSVYGFWKLKLLVRSHTHSWLLAWKRYITDITWPFSLSTAARETTTSSTWRHQLAVQFNYCNTKPCPRETLLAYAQRLPILPTHTYVHNAHTMTHHARMHVCMHTRLCLVFDIQTRHDKVAIPVHQTLSKHSDRVLTLLKAVLHVGLVFRVVELVG